jgi:hypothetical protein
MQNMLRKREERAMRSRARTLRLLAFLWSFWWWLPPSGRRQLLRLARRHGPWLVKREFTRRRHR